MDFKDNEAIYLQIADRVSENILLEKWKPEDKVPSVRDMAGEMQVNPNTVIRTYDFLEKLGVIYTKRGLGFFVCEDAIGKIVTYKKQNFMEKDLPGIFRNMNLLKIDMTEIAMRYKEFMTKN